MKNLIRYFLILGFVVLSGSIAPAQTPGTARVMREKLAHSQKILEAILTSDFALLDRESAALTKVTQLPAWTTLRGPEYLRQSEAFLKVLGELRESAKDHDLDTAARQYNDLTTTCFACHRYMKDRRLAR
jgi:hypothetical protein